MRRLAGAVMILIGTAAFTACLRSVAAGMRDVIRVDGGSCGTGGPYVIVHQCSGGDIRLLLVGIFGGLMSAALYAGGTSALGRLGGGRTGRLVRGVRGTRLELPQPVPASGRRPGRLARLLIPGILFEVMAAGALIPLIGGIRDDLRQGNQPDNAFARLSGPPIVRAAMPAGFSPAQQFGYGFSPASANGSLTDAIPQPKMTLPLATLGLWLTTSAVGAVIGVVLSSSLINLLK